MTLTSATSTTQAVINHHLERFAALDLDLQGLLTDYAPDAVMIVPTGLLRGVYEIAPLFQNLTAEFAKPGATFDLQQQVIEGDVGYIWWTAETPDNSYELGTDTFFVRHGKIAVQTFGSKRRPKPNPPVVSQGTTRRGGVSRAPRSSTRPPAGRC